MRGFLICWCVRLSVYLVFIYEELQQNITVLSFQHLFHCLARRKRFSLSITPGMVPGTTMEALTTFVWM